MFEAPEAINWNYTYNCNFNCSHCYSRAPSYPSELSAQDYQQLALKIVGAQIFRVAFGGGEPLIRKDFIDTLRYFGDHGLQTYFTTNGWLIDDQVSDNLVRSDVAMVAVSLDSSVRERHDHIRGQQGSFDRALKAVRLLSGRIGRVATSCTVQKQNVRELRELVDLSLSSGADEVNLKVFRPAGNGLALELDLKLSSDELNEFRSVAEDLKRIHGDRITIYGPESEHGCVCGTTTLTLRPNGDLAVCPYGTEVVGNLLTDELSEIWTRHPLLEGRRLTPNTCIGTQNNLWPLGRSTGPTQELSYVDRLKRRWRTRLLC